MYVLILLEHFLILWPCCHFESRLQRVRNLKARIPQMRSELQLWAKIRLASALSASDGVENDNVDEVIIK
jgi:hypothetical protein